MSETQTLWTAHDLADYLGVSKNTLSYWRLKGVGPQFLRVGRHVRYRPSDVENWLVEHQQ